MRVWRALIGAASGGGSLRRWTEAFTNAILVGALVVANLFIWLLVVFGYSTATVYGGSMEPAIGRGSLVIFRPMEPAEVRLNDVVLYKNAGASMPVLHRVVSVREVDGRRFFTLKGDANDTADAVEVELQGGAGVPVVSVPFAGYAAAAIASAWGRVAVLSAAFACVVFLGLRAIWSTERRPAARA
jgi:signal peptidase